jgi:adenine-specific DNA-methyltransferase
VSRLTDLIAQAKAKDPQMGADLDREFKVLSSRLPYGLNFERHRPEAVELPQRPIRKGDKVRVLPERGSTAKADPRLWQVKAIHNTGHGRAADLERLDEAGQQTQTVALGDLVVVAEFRDTIYPGLVSTGKVERGGDKPFHTVINGENYHVLKALTYTHRGKVDAIYIDPPYNTGAKDWKYNNDYVEGDDLYRHSKWLAMMERRLLVAKELLNPADSVLIVTIDEKEYLRLGLLLEQVFPEARIQMVSSVINPASSSRAMAFSRSDEYIFFVFMGISGPVPVHLSADWYPKTGRDSRGKARWQELYRRGADGIRTKSPGCFYPVFIKEDGTEFVDVGGALPEYQHPSDVNIPEGVVASWPIRSDGTEGRWSMTPDKLRTAIAKGYVRIGNVGANGYGLTYLAIGEQKKVEDGSYPIVGYRADGSVITGEQELVELVPSTQWRIPSHDASAYGSQLLRAILPNRRFPFPKSLYAVEDALRFFVANRPDAIVLDFFTGSGTTAHAVMRLNRQDGGRRKCISVTNNEVAASEHEALRRKMLRPGDAEWEQHGICDYITKPRVKAAITGRTPDGEPIKGDYKFTDEFPMAEGFEENAEFFTLTYETPVSVNHNRAFARIAPLLWLRAGSRGQRIDKLPEAGWEVMEAYGLLVEVDRAEAYCEAIRQAPGVGVAFIVTDDDRRFQAIARQLPKGVEPVRLYESYLTNFSFANGEDGGYTENQG